MSGTEDNKAKVRKMQQVILQIMCDIDDFCRKNDITYFLSGGTCLGAVRHQGFIPWDDDADLMMPRKDYEKFLASFPGQYQGKYSAGALSIDEHWQRQYAKVWDKETILRTTNIEDVEMGVFVDIFPIDGLPAGKIARKIYYARIKLLSAMANACVKKAFLEGEHYRTIKRIAGLVLRHFERRSFSERMERLATKYDFDASQYVGASLSAHYGDRETIRREEMSREVRHLFESREFPLPTGYETYLTNLYGDYMTVPPGAEEKGYSHLDHWEIEFK